MCIDELTIEQITVKNVDEYKCVIDSIKYICSYSGYDPEKINLIEEIRNPELPKDGKKENNKIYGIKENISNNPVAWVQYYRNYMNTKTIFIGELYIRKTYQNKGLGRTILDHYEKEWRSEGYSKVVLNVDLKNWIAIHFWITNGYTKIEELIGDKEYSANTYAQMNLSKNI